MKQIQLLNNYENVLSILHREAEIYERKIVLTGGVERQVLKSIRNRILESAMNLQFSNCVNAAFGKRAALTDIDCILYVNGRVRAIIEMKRRAEDFRRYVMANARQFFILRKFARKFDVPLIYIFRIDDNYRILEANTDEFVEVRKLGRGYSEDYYALWNIKDSTFVRYSDVPDFLRGLVH